MIKVNITNALVKSVSPLINVNDKFCKRELILDDGWEKDGQRHENPICVEFGNESASMLAGIVPGLRVNVEAYINGREHSGKHYTSLRGKNVAPAIPQAYPQQPAPGYPTQGAYPSAYPQNGYPQATYTPPAPYPQTDGAYPPY